MSTRGVYGFYKKGIDKITYCGSDAYPGSLGYHVVSFIRSHSLQELERIFSSITLVNKDEFPTPEEFTASSRWFSHPVDTEQSQATWGRLLYNVMGDLDVYHEGLTFMVDNVSFIQNSLHCEWGYIINLDDQVIEIYEGFNEQPQSSRYSVSEPSRSGHYQCKHLISFPLMAIPYNWLEQINRLSRYGSDEDESSFLPEDNISAAPIITHNVLTAAGPNILVINAHSAKLNKQQAEDLICTLQEQIQKM